MKKFEDLTPMVNESKIYNLTHVRGLVEGMLFVSLLVVLFFMVRPDMIFALANKSDVELVQLGRTEVNTKANESLKEAMSNVFKQ